MLYIKEDSTINNNKGYIYIKGCQYACNACKKFKIMPRNMDNCAHKAPVNDETEQMNIYARFLSVSDVWVQAQVQCISHYKAVLLGLREGAIADYFIKLSYCQVRVLLPEPKASGLDNIIIKALFLIISIGSLGKKLFLPTFLLDPLVSLMAMRKTRVKTLARSVSYQLSEVVKKRTFKKNSYHLRNLCGSYQ